MTLIEVIRKALLNNDREAIAMTVSMLGRIKLVEMTDEECATLRRLLEKEGK